jgi:heme/copper-type cytochrome/quinol oxidase subunit 2
LALVFTVPVTLPSSPVTQRVMLEANQYAFSPGRIRVNQGDTVIFEVQALDVVHGFYLDGYGEEIRLEPGLTREVRIIADRPGKFRIRCSVSCGVLHPFMLGELIVGPNIPFWRALIGALIAALGMYFFASRKTEGGLHEQVSKHTTRAL